MTSNAETRRTDWLTKHLDSYAATSRKSLERQDAFREELAAPKRAKDALGIRTGLHSLFLAAERFNGFRENKFIMDCGPQTFINIAVSA